MKEHRTPLDRVRFERDCLRRQADDIKETKNVLMDRLAEKDAQIEELKSYIDKLHRNLLAAKSASITYKTALKNVSDKIDSSHTLDYFSASTTLAIVFNNSKEEAITDLIKYREMK